MARNMKTGKLHVFYSSPMAPKSAMNSRVSSTLDLAAMSVRELLAVLKRTLLCLATSEAMRLEVLGDQSSHTEVRSLERPGAAWLLTFPLLSASSVWDPKIPQAKHPGPRACSTSPGCTLGSRHAPQPCLRRRV